MKYRGIGAGSSTGTLLIDAHAVDITTPSKVVAKITTKNTYRNAVSTETSL
jgi:hypothetical protein